MRIVILATEPSGDFLGSELIKELKKKNNIKIFGVGGELMESIGMNSWVPIKKFNAIGLYEVVIRIIKFIRLFRFIEKKIIDCKPDIVITIDSPSFSYRIVKKLQHLRKRTQFIHYVAPTVWAWKSYRAKIFSRLYDKIFTLFKFEPKYFTKYGLNSQFVGHQIFYKKLSCKNSEKIISFFPGSRSVEIKNNMRKLKKIILSSANIFTDYNLYILTFEHEKKNLERMINSKKIKVISDKKLKHQIMKKSYIAVAASGSVTLELINYKIPTLVFYETHWLTKILIKSLVNVKYASIINIFYNKEIISEFLFEKFTHDNIINSMKKLIYNDKSRLEQIKYFEDFSKNMLVNRRNPSEVIVKSLDI